MNNPSFCIKYKVLKPDQLIADICKAFRETQNNYQLAITPHRTIRKYRFDCANIQQLLQISEWRLDAIQQVAHSYFVRLSKPKREFKTIQCEVFLEHMQVTVGEMNRLIIQECFYLMNQSAKGYKHLISKFKTISVNSNTFGLNSHGQCIVWINQDLNSLAPEVNPLISESEIILELVKAIQQRSEPISMNLLSKIMEEVKRKQLKFADFLEYINNLAASMRIQIPKDLKYLVNQHRIYSDIQKIRLKNETMESRKKQHRDKQETQRLRPNRTQTGENIFATHNTRIVQQRAHRLSQYNHFNTLRATSSFEGKKFVTEKTINMKKESYMSTNISSMITNSDKKLEFRRATSNDRHQFTFHFSKSRERTAISKCRSDEGRNDNIYIINAAKPLEKLKFAENNSEFWHNSSAERSLCKENQKQPGTKWHFSERTNSFRGKQINKVQSQKVYRSFVVDFPRRIDIKNKSIGEECQEHESSPNKQKITNSIEEDEVNGSDENGSNKSEEQMKVNKIQECLKANQWIKNLDSHQLWVQEKLNTSITLGQEKSSYLQDVKLQKLELLTRHLAASRLPNEDFYPIYSQTIIE